MSDEQETVGVSFITTCGLLNRPWHHHVTLRRYPQLRISGDVNPVHVIANLEARQPARIQDPTISIDLLFEALMQLE